VFVQLNIHDGKEMRELVVEVIARDSMMKTLSLLKLQALVLAKSHQKPQSDSNHLHALKASERLFWEHLEATEPETSDKR